MEATEEGQHADTSCNSSHIRMRKRWSALGEWQKLEALAKVLRPFLEHPIIASIIASVPILFLTLWLTGSGPFQSSGSGQRYLCGNRDALGAEPEFPGLGVSHVRGGFTIADAPTVFPAVNWGGGNVDCEYFRLPLARGERIEIEWHKLAGDCCMHFYLWSPSVTYRDLAYATPDELKDRHPSLSLQVAPGNSAVEYEVPFTGKATLQVGDANGVTTEPYWFVLRSLPRAS